LSRSENPDVKIRKFFREVQLSGILTEAKKRRYREKEVSRVKRRNSARRKAVKNARRRGW
jgi:ribosomal protein S21